MSEEQLQQPDELTPEELDELHAEELPQREALSVLRIPFLGAQPIEPPSEPDVSDA